MIDEELRRALDVDPSPEFVAHVRARIAGEPLRVSVWRGWLIPVAAMAAIVAMAAAATRLHKSVPIAHGGEPLIARSLAKPALMTVVTSPPPISRAFERERPVEPPVAARNVQAASLILVDPREAAALEKLLRTGPLRPAETLATPNVDPIAIEPIVITPLDLGDEGARQ